MKHLILLLFLSFFCLCLRAQTNIKMGTPYPAIEDGYRAYIPYNNQVLALKSTKKVTTFYRIDPKTLSTTLIGEFKLPKNIHNLERVMELGGKHYAFYTLHDFPNRGFEISIRSLS